LPSPPVITLEELAGQLHVKPTSARATVRRLQDNHGFPHALPGLPARFSRHLVDLWLRTNGHALAAPLPANDRPADAVAAQRAHLEQRYGVAP
jgi:hypothetical protein